MLKRFALTLALLAGCVGPDDEVTPRSGPVLMGFYPSLTAAVDELVAPCVDLDNPAVTVVWTELLQPGPKQFWRLELAALSNAAMADCIRERLVKAGAEPVPSTTSGGEAGGSTGG